jgi:hypothetical protein
MDSRFLKKILTDDEIEIVNLSQNSDMALWSLWACKEAAYKVIKKSHNTDSFIPRRWSVNIGLTSAKQPASSGAESNDCLINNIGGYSHPQTSYRKGQVNIPGREAVSVRLFSHPSYVHCVGAESLSTLDQLSWGIDVLPESGDGNPSSFARQCLVRSLAGFLHLNSSDIEIKRMKNGAVLQPPCVYIGGKKVAIDISLSHDGRLIAYAFNETR